MSLVVDNPYRVFGVSSQASARQLSANYKQMMSDVLKGNDIELGQDMLNFIKPPLRTPRRLDQAKTQLSSVRGRFYHALFWFSDTSKVDHAARYYLANNEREKAVKLLQTQVSFSSYINLAVLALMEERYDDAATLYVRLFQDEEMTQAFVHSVVGDKFPVKGAFIQSKVLDILNREKEKKERDDNSDERSFAGAGFGVRNQEAQDARIRLVMEQPKNSLAERFTLRKEALEFDRHLNSALNLLIERIYELNEEYGITDDFAEVDVNQNPSAQMMLDEFTRFLAVNHTLLEAFRQRCSESRQRRMYLDYVYNVVSLANYAFHLYSAELGRIYSPELVQQLRSIIAKFDRLYFRFKDDDIDMLIASLRRIEDALPYYNALTTNFQKFYLLGDDKQRINNFYQFNNTSNQILDKFAATYGLNGDYMDCALPLQDMVVRYNVSFMLNMVNIALRHNYKVTLPNKGINEQELKVDESRFGGYGVEEKEPQENVEPVQAQDLAAALKPSTQVVAAQNQSNAQEQADNKAQESAPQEKEVKEPKVKLTKEEKILKKEQAKKEKAQELKLLEEKKRRANYFKRQLARHRERFIRILEIFDSYSVTPNTNALIGITLRQVNRLPKPLSVKQVAIGVALVIIAAGAIYLNTMMG